MKKERWKRLGSLLVLCCVFVLCGSIGAWAVDSAARIHQKAWSEAAENIGQNRYFKYGLYSSRSLMVHNPEIYLKADGFWLDEILTVYPGWQSDYEDRDRSLTGEERWKRVDGIISDGFMNNTRNTGTTEFSWAKFRWGEHRANAVSLQSFYRSKGLDFFLPWADQRLPFIWNSLKGIGWKIPELSLAECLYFEKKSTGGTPYLLISDSGKGYLVSKDDLIDPLSGKVIEKVEIEGSIVLVMNHEDVWYPLMERDDRARNADLRTVVSAYCEEGRKPVLTELEASLLEKLKKGTTIQDELDENWAVFFASRTGKQNAWNAEPMRKLCSKLFPDRYAENQNRPDDNPYEVVALNMVVTELANRLSPAAARLAALGREKTSVVEAMKAIAGQYESWFKRSDNGFVYGYYYCNWLPTLEDKLLSGLGDCFVEAGNVGAAMQLMDKKGWHTWIANWWDKNDKGGHVIAGVYSDTERGMLSNGLFDNSCTEGPLHTFEGRFIFALVYKTNSAFLTTGQSYNGRTEFSPFITPFTNLSSESGLALIHEIAKYEPDFEVAIGNTFNMQYQKLSPYISDMETKKEQWKSFWPFSYVSPAPLPEHEPSPRPKPTPENPSSSGSGGCDSGAGLGVLALAFLCWSKRRQAV